MHRTLLRSSIAGLVLAATALGPAAGQVDTIPKISPRSYVSGSLTLVVRGAIQIDQVIPLNNAASYSAGNMTWLQYGDSGSAAPNVGVTFSTFEVGVSVGRGRFIATGGMIPGEQNQCTGRTDVTAASVSGQYQCKGVVSYEPGGSGSGKVDIDVRFTAQS